MTDWFVFDPIYSGSILTVTILLLGIGFFIIEVRRPTRYKLGRIISLVVMLLSLTAIVFRPSVKSIQSESIGILTENYDPKKVDSVLAHEPIQLVAVPGVDVHKNARELQSLNELESLSGKISYIFGNGLPSHAHGLLQKDSYQFISTDYPQGIIDIHLPSYIYANHQCTIEGIFNSGTSGKLILETAGQKEDSTMFGESGLQKFSLQFTPRQAGNFLYTLISQDQNGNETRASLPISVSPQQSFNILCIQNFPTFETQYLKKFLGKNNQLQLRYQLSKNTFRHEAINAQNKKINRLNAENLQQFDVLIIDSDALESLSSSEISDLKRATKNGLGVMIIFNQSPQNLRATKSFIPTTFAKYESDTAKLNIQKSVSLRAWPVKPQPTSRLRPIHQTKNRIVSAYSNDEFGKAGYSKISFIARVASKTSGHWPTTPNSPNQKQNSIRIHERRIW